MKLKFEVKKKRSENFEVKKMKWKFEVKKEEVKKWSEKVSVKEKDLFIKKNTTIILYIVGVLIFSKKRNQK